MNSREPQCNTWFILSLWAVASLVGPATPSAQDCADYGAYFQLAGTIATDAANGVAVAGDRAYVAAGDAGLLVVDISDPDDPVVLDTVPFPFALTGVWCSDERLLVVDVLSRLYAYPLPLPPSPAYHNVVVSYTIEDMKVVGTLAYTAFSPGQSAISGFLVYDVTDVENGAIESIVITGQPGIAVDVQGDLACLMTGEYGQGGELRVIDVADPENTQVLATMPVYVEISDVAIHGDTVYLSELYWGLERVDISDPANPALGYPIGLNLFGERRLTVAGDHLYVAESAGDPQCTMYALDLGDPDQLFIAGSCFIPVAASVMGVSNGRIALAGGADGVPLAVFDAQAVPGVAGWLPTPASIRALAIRSRQVYGILATPSFQVFDISAPTAPIPVGNVPLPGSGSEIALGDGHAFVALGSTGIAAIDIADPDQPVLVDVIPVPDGAYDLVLRSDHLYVAAATAGVQVVDVTEPGAWGVVNEIDLFEEIWNIDATDEIVVVAGHWSLYLYDIAAPASPSPRGVGDLGTSTTTLSLSVRGDRAYVESQGVHAWPEYGVRVLDISDPDSPYTIGFVDPRGFIGELVLSGEHAYAPSVNNGLMAFDLAGAGPMAFLGSARLDHPSSCAALTFNEYVYVGTTEGLAVAWRQCGDVTPVHDDATPRGPGGTYLTSVPNPFNPRTTITFTLDRPQPVGLAVFDLAGRRLVTLTAGLRDAGEHRVVWDGRDAAGRALPSGSYLIVLATEEGRQAQKATLLR